MVHGEDTVCDLFAERLINELGLDAYAPYSGTEFDLAANEFIRKPQGVRIEKTTAVAAAAKVSKLYQKLVAAGQRLVGVIRKNEGGANGIWSGLRGRSMHCVTSGIDKLTEN